jgi:hypothetical protein
VCPIQFADVPSSNGFYAYVRCLACRGIVSGYPCGGAGEPCDPNQDPYYRPSNQVTRSQLAKFVSNAAGYSDPIPSNRQTFADVPVSHPFWLWIERGAARGIFTGYPCGGPGEPCPGSYFRPGNNITRGQLAKLVALAAGYGDPLPACQATFQDVPPDSSFWPYVERVTLHSVMSGYPCGGAPGEPCCPGNCIYFRPRNAATRGQVAKTVANAFFPGCQSPDR